jgi:hypothetical protein
MNMHCATQDFHIRHGDPTSARAVDIPEHSPRSATAPCWLAMSLYKDHSLLFAWILSLTNLTVLLMLLVKESFLLSIDFQERFQSLTSSHSRPILGKYIVRHVQYALGPGQLVNGKQPSQIHLLVG